MAARRPCRSMFPLFNTTELSGTVYVTGGGKTPDFRRKLMKGWFNGGGITTSPLVLQRRRPRTAAGTLLSPPNFSANAPKNCECHSCGDQRCFLAEVRVFLCDETRVHVLKLL